MPRPAPSSVRRLLSRRSAVASSSCRQFSRGGTRARRRPGAPDGAGALRRHRVRRVGALRSALSSRPGARARAWRRFPGRTARFIGVLLAVVLLRSESSPHVPSLGRAVSRVRAATPLVPRLRLGIRTRIFEDSDACRPFDTYSTCPARVPPAPNFGLSAAGCASCGDHGAVTVRLSRFGFWFALRGGRPGRREEHEGEKRRGRFS